MALINCPKCKKEISNKEKACPYCGFRLEDTVNPSYGEPGEGVWGEGLGDGVFNVGSGEGVWGEHKGDGVFNGEPGEGVWGEHKGDGVHN